jgi:hypothetical protein
VSDYIPLGPDTWEAFARFAELHNGVWGGCWCTWFHTTTAEKRVIGVVEAYPHDTEGKKVSASFLYNGTRSLFERADFTYVRAKGKKNCVMRTVIS